jgi:hypothetical protein
MRKGLASRLCRQRRPILVAQVVRGVFKVINVDLFVAYREGVEEVRESPAKFTILETLNDYRMVSIHIRHKVNGGGDDRGQTRSRRRPRRRGSGPLFFGVRHVGGNILKQRRRQVPFIPYRPRAPRYSYKAHIPPPTE